MPLSAHHTAIKDLYSARIAHVSAEPTGMLLCRGLQFLLEHPQEFDACVAENNPFYQEFTARLAAGAHTDEDIFSLFECLAIFFRLKQFHNNTVPQSTVEKQVLAHFESSGEWQPHDNTLVSLWYWWRIPSPGIN